MKVFRVVDDAGYHGVEPMDVSGLNSDRARATIMQRWKISNQEAKNIIAKTLEKGMCVYHRGFVSLLS